MKKTVALICCFLMFSLPFSFVFVQAEKDNFALPTQTASQCFIVTDATTGQVYIQKNAEEKKFPASITKLLTVALVLEKGNLDDVITVSKTAVSLPSEATRANFYEGEEITVRDAVYAAILVSGNDAANALAEYIAGTNENFAELMNEKAAQCGCTNTHFSNPSGLQYDDHFTTAADFAKLMKYILAQENIYDIIGAKTYVMAKTNKTQFERTFETLHLMGQEGEFAYGGFLGGKTGWETDAHHTMVTVAQKNGRTLVCTVLDSVNRNEKFDDTKNLLDYCFDNFYEIKYKPKTLKVPIDASENGEVLNYEPIAIPIALHNSVQKNDIICAYTDAPETVQKQNAPPVTLQLKLSYDNFFMNGDILTQTVMPTKTGGYLFQFKNPFKIFWETKAIPMWVKYVIICIVIFGIVLLVKKYRQILKKTRHLAYRQRRKYLMIKSQKSHQNIGK